MYRISAGIYLQKRGEKVKHGSYRFFEGGWRRRGFLEMAIRKSAAVQRILQYAMAF